MRSAYNYKIVRRKRYLPTFSNKRHKLLIQTTELIIGDLQIYVHSQKVCILFDGDNLIPIYTVDEWNASIRRANDRVHFLSHQSSMKSPMCEKNIIRFYLGLNRWIWACVKIDGSCQLINLPYFDCWVFGHVRGFEFVDVGFCFCRVNSFCWLSMLSWYGFGF